MFVRFHYTNIEDRRDKIYSVISLRNCSIQRAKKFKTLLPSLKFLSNLDIIHVIVASPCSGYGLRHYNGYYIKLPRKTPSRSSPLPLIHVEHKKPLSCIPQTSAMTPGLRPLSKWLMGQKSPLFCLLI
jgi:hypothetical protein